MPTSFFFFSLFYSFLFCRNSVVSLELAHIYPILWEAIVDFGFVLLISLYFLFFFFFDDAVAVHC
ncbi:hypothetical protein BDY21DRAFT_63066 [Lineolata rhizophorae]|uniref:Uncharacterized protein n=1 Tax=Lineolata rhizophorae TaxID=578093 RepID=A0A6A6NWL0_9PEZI|nr:hypothetical protein BDY21DRAFT_63066 [Lineolata rhizophorae]